MENKASNNEDYMESYVMDLILMDGTRAEDITKKRKKTIRSFLEAKRLPICSKTVKRKTRSS